MSSLKKEKIDVSFAFREQMVDFGSFKSKDKKLKVDFKFWKKYVDARLQFEIMHAKLLNKIPRKHFFDSLKATTFVNHIEKHLEEMKVKGKVVCKICNKDIDDIFNEGG